MLKFKVEITQITQILQLIKNKDDDDIHQNILNLFINVLAHIVIKIYDLFNIYTTRKNAVFPNTI